MLFPSTGCEELLGRMFNLGVESPTISVMRACICRRDLRIRAWSCQRFSGLRRNRKVGAFLAQPSKIVRECLTMHEQKIATEDLRGFIQELHNHMRHNMALWIQWFTFFISINYVAFGWFAGSDSTKPPSHIAVKIAAALFISQCSLGIWISLSFRRWLKKADRELFGLYQRVHAERSEPTFSAQFYQLGVLLACVAMAALIIGWLALVHWLPLPQSISIPK